MKNKEKVFRTKTMRLDLRQIVISRPVTQAYLVMHKSACMDGHALIGGYLFADATM